ncbi:hypothetical protein [Polyangium jinanense]|uniref:Porin n=1 Tax=Polyangium jinanense TaxID=2829994 RepID=A0A9X4AZF4_9BACT|nr:hypothetical protein [Polyangium jinanense]MDC3958405.1 hypothetical protein [Polyangium jinanense]MDC3988265.1 hypothetical protein [Polyangium jinanense]
MTAFIAPTRRPSIPGPALAAAAFLLLATRPAAADDDAPRKTDAPAAAKNDAPPAPKTSPNPAPTSARKALAVAGSFVPGALVHGTGHLVLGHTRTGLVLLGAEGLGLGLIVAGLGGAAATGATRRFIGPIILGTVTGAAFFFLSALADVYGVLAPEGGTGSPPVYLPSVETQLGVTFVHDPNFAYNAFLTPGADLRAGSFRLSALGFFALDDTNARTRISAAYRFFGPRPSGSERARDGSYLDVEFALTNHSYGTEGFSVTTGEVNLLGRLDLARVGPTLRGSFAELGLGLAYAAHRYPGIGVEANDLLTPRMAFGMYLGHSGYPRGEAMAYYEHRHDGFAGGFKSPGLGSGIAGHFGAQTRLFFTPRWGAFFDVQGGSALVGRASLLFRYGGNP